MNQDSSTSGPISPPNFSKDVEKASFNRTVSQRKMKSSDTNSDSNETFLITMGKIYHRIVSFSAVTRYIVYIVPIGVMLAVPIVMTSILTPLAQTGGVRLVWIFSWTEIIWCSFWAAKLVAKLIPSIFMFLCGVVSSGTTKYVAALKHLEIPITLILWA